MHSVTYPVVGSTQPQQTANMKLISGGRKIRFREVLSSFGSCVHLLQVYYVDA